MSLEGKSRGQRIDHFEERVRMMEIGIAEPVEKGLEDQARQRIRAHVAQQMGLDDVSGIPELTG